jgi:organic hydroperoxide reductase OsmC/OhrA
MTQTVTAQPIVKRKTFHYETDVSWLVDRAGMLESSEKPELRVSSPPEFHGESGVWTPEDLYVGALNVCLMSTFLAYAEKKRLKILSYESKAKGLLEFSGGEYWITSVEIKPKIEAASIEDAALAERIIFEAHDNCFLSNSVKTEITVKPDITIREKSWEIDNET